MGESETAPMNAIYRAIFTRRDVRSEFLPRPVPAAVLARLLLAAHHAPSVGLSQPWRFILVKDPVQRGKVLDEFTETNSQAAQMFGRQRRARYRAMKLEGIQDAPVNLCIVCERRADEPILGGTHQPDTDVYSTVCAVQNLWLAARTEDIGVGWVSIMRPQQLADILELPDSVLPIAYLCLGYVSHFRDRPELEQAGWDSRRALASMLFSERWGQPLEDDALLTAVSEWSQWPATIVGDAGKES
ncbi:MAG: 5,6-dimethylbenzimidazole synthase [Pseudomonadota bacterium]